MSTVKQEAARMVENLAADATEAVEAGLADSDADCVMEAGEVRRRFGLPE